VHLSYFAVYAPFGVSLPDPARATFGPLFLSLLSDVHNYVLPTCLLERVFLFSLRTYVHTTFVSRELWKYLHYKEVLNVVSMYLGTILRIPVFDVEQEATYLHIFFGAHTHTLDFQRIKGKDAFRAM